jgi:glycerophosphoryl diester phosphodiesterase
VKQKKEHSMKAFKQTARQTVLMCALASLLAACGGGTSLPAQTPLLTLDGNAPLVVGHRGASGFLPEHTLEAYSLAIEQGADVIEPDLVSTKDGVLISRHDPNLDFSTNVASKPEFASRKKTVSVDGEVQTGWFASDFTLAEIKTLGANMTTDATRPQQFNGLYKVATFQEIVDLAIAKTREKGRPIAVYPETKNPTYHRDLGLPLEDNLIAIINKTGWNSKTSPIFVQSFEPSSLKYMRQKGLNTRLIQLIDADDYDLKTGKLTFAPPYDRPWDWFRSGDKRLFSDMVTVAGLTEIKTYADGIGPWKPYIVPVKWDLTAAGVAIDKNGDGKTDLTDAVSQTPTSLVADAHRLGLLVHPYTFRSEKRRLTFDMGGDPANEYLQFFRIGVDGMFSDFPDAAVAARNRYLRETGR